MTPDAQHIAISQHLGWQLRDSFEARPNYRSWIPPGKPRSLNYYYTDCPPSFLSDLNAIHAAVHAQPSDFQWAWFAELAAIVDAKFPAALGSAAQCSEAFLRAANLWKS
jgi:hypothetical protein